MCYTNLKWSLPIGGQATYKSGCIRSSSLQAKMTSIPTPPSVPFIGHAASIDKEVPLYSLALLAKQYGEIYQLNMLGEADVTLFIFIILIRLCQAPRR